MRSARQASGTSRACLACGYRPHDSVTPAYLSRGLGQGLRERRALWSADGHDARGREQPEDLPPRVDLEPAGREVRARAPLVVVVLEQLAHGEEVEGQRVAAFVAVVEVLVAVLVTRPVHDRPVHRPEDEVEREHQRDLPPVGGEHQIEGRVGHPERDPGGPGVREPLQPGPLRDVAVEPGLRLGASVRVVRVPLLRLPHHRERVGVQPGRVRVAIGVAERVVLAVQDRVGARVQVRAALHQEREEVQHALGALRHGVHAVRGIPMLEQALEEDAQEPVRDEESVDQGPSGVDLRINRALSSQCHTCVSRRYLFPYPASICGPGAGPRSSSRYRSHPWSTGPSNASRPWCSTAARGHSSFAASKLWETKQKVTPAARKSRMRALHFSWKRSSPTASTSSTIRTSGSTSWAMANPSRAYMPELEFLMGMSMKSAISEKATIRSNFRFIC